MSVSPAGTVVIRVDGMVFTFLSNLESGAWSTSDPRDEAASIVRELEAASEPPFTHDTALDWAVRIVDTVGFEGAEVISHEQGEPWSEEEDDEGLPRIY